MKILLTGGVGYIGSHAAVAFVEAGYEVVLYDNLCNSKADVLERLENITTRRLTLVLGDVRDTVLLTNTLREQQIDAVVHFAGLKAVGESTSQPIDYYANNVVGTISLLQAMSVVNIRKLVFSSSATVYGDPQYLPVDEIHPTSAANPYGRTKLNIEEMLCDLATSDSSWSIACLRYFNPVGAHESGLIGEEPNGVPSNLMPNITQVASGQIASLNIYGDDYPTPDGTCLRDYVHVMDVADGHLAATRYLDKHQGCYAFNLGTGEGLSVLEMVRAFEVCTGQPVPFQISPRRPGDGAACYAKVDKAKIELSWLAKRTIEDMCTSAWNWQKQRQASQS